MTPDAQDARNLDVWGPEAENLIRELGLFERLTTSPARQSGIQNLFEEQPTRFVCALHRAGNFAFYAMPKNCPFVGFEVMMHRVIASLESEGIIRGGELVKI